MNVLASFYRFRQSKENNNLIASIELGIGRDYNSVCLAANFIIFLYHILLSLFCSVLHLRFYWKMHGMKNFTVHHRTNDSYVCLILEE